MIDQVRSNAVVAFTGRGRSPVPVGDMDAVRRIRAGAGDDLVGYVRRVANDIFVRFPLDWRGERGDLQPEQVVVLIEEAVLDRYPELSREAAAALAWMWSYSSWK